MQSSNSFKESLSLAFNIPVIPENRRYWLVRTHSGDYYQDFVDGNFIAIDSKISQDMIEKALEQEKYKKVLKEKIEQEFPNEERPGLLAGYIANIIYEMQAGDVILIPSKDSKVIAFGEVEISPAYFETAESMARREYRNKDHVRKIVCPYTLRRRVRWVKFVSKGELDLHLIKAFFSHNTISCIDQYGYTIDRTLNTLFIKGNELHYKLKITRKDPIPMSVYFELMESIKILADEFNESSKEYKCDFDQITIKMQAESPGFGELITLIPQIVDIASDHPYLLFGFPIILFISVLVVGGKLKIPFLKYETPGLLSQIFEWYKYNQEHKTLGTKKFENAYKKLQDSDPKKDNVLPLPKTDESNKN